MSELLATGRPVTATAEMAALSLLLAFGLSYLISAVYVWTFRGMSYSKGLVHAMVIGGAIAATLMLAIGNSVAAGIGIAGGLSLIRFRTALRDPRDMMFVFAALGAGIASGLGAYEVAVLGTLLFCVATVTLTVSEFGGQRRFDGLLRCRIAADGDQHAVQQLLRRFSRVAALVTLREVAQGDALEYAYQVRLARPQDRTDLVRALEQLPGVEDASLLLQEPTVEL